MTAAYKLALAAGATLLLIVIASLILRSDNAPADIDPEGTDPLAMAETDAPPADEFAADPPSPENVLPGPPHRGTDADTPTDPADRPATRANYPDQAEVVEPIGPAPNGSMTVGRNPFEESDPFNRPAFNPLGEPVNPTPPEPEPIDPAGVAEGSPPPEGDLPPTADAAETSNPAANTGIALGPLDPPAPGSPPGTPGTAADETAFPTPPPAPAILKLYTIEAGDNLSSIALATYGSATQWVDIAQANPLVDPNRLKVGQEIKLPDLTGEGASTTASSDTPAATGEGDADLPRRGTTYIVKAGDNLNNIAKQFYSATAKWELIYQANRRTIGDDPAALKVGMELRIPPPDSGAN